MSRASAALAGFELIIVGRFCGDEGKRTPEHFACIDQISATVGLVLLLVRVAFERGTWEGLMMRNNAARDGKAFRNLRPELNKYRNVWFVGHSLGGAIALLTFLLYRKWCRR